MRVHNRGLVDHDRPVSFRFNGRAFTGYEGDTLASALLAAGERLVARSFKYHRPRGVLTAGSEEPNALVTIGRDAGATPNVRATMQEIFAGLEARSQNAWPSLGFDLMAVNDLAAPFIGAGFYYKTFMWPAKFWERLYEPLIRRAAGLGALSGAPDTAPRERAFAFCDLLVIGAGPAGLMAALTAGRAGADVILCDEQPRTGGRLLGETETVGGVPGPEWAAAVTAELESLPNVRVMARTTVLGAYDGGTWAAIERVNLHRAPPADAPLETFWRIVAKRAILAAGAIERPIAFRDNDRPGIMVASAVRTYLHRFGAIAGPRVAVFGNNDDAHRTAHDLAAAGLTVAALIDSREDAAVTGAFPVFKGAQVTGTRGRSGLTGLTVTDRAGDHPIEADCLAVSGGWNPNIALACHTGGRPIWNDAIAAFLPPEAGVPGLTVAGAAAGIFSTHGALASGAQRASEALADLGLAATAPDLPEAGDAPVRLTPLWQVPGHGRAWLDFQNDVTVKDVALAAREGFASVEHMKRYTTQGMATDQGKNSNVGALAILADITGKGIPATGITTYRPPYVPMTIATVGAGGAGMGFAPQRFTTSHAASVDRGAPMIEAGLWYRPSYFPRPGETTWREACDREVHMVRSAVGVVDVSTLGKIDVQGGDAAAFLDFVYTNTFSTLPVGRCRYGLMLREDGFVMDDGTSARLAPDHFVMTTTTAAAGPVLKHLEFVRQAFFAGRDVRLISVTEQWAQFSVAGPRALELVNAVADSPIDDTWFPFMACGETAVGGVAGRLFRISFSGERAYEIAVPARYGASLWRILLAQAENFGGGPYGMEALNVMRIEKGFITHAEIDGRATAFDIGLQGMVSQKKDCIGKTMSERPGLMEDRDEMVGLQPLQSGGRIAAGAFLFAENADATRANAQGRVTSACHSPTLGHALGLGFLRNGRARMGEVVRLVDHLRKVETRCRVSPPVAYDPEGSRAR